MQVVRHPDAESAAAGAAAFVVDRIADAISRRGRAAVALSGGSTTPAMLIELSRADVDWQRVHIFQVDERIAPDGDPDRNATGLHEALLSRVAIPPSQVHLMPVGDPDLDGVDLDGACRWYSAQLPAAFDVVHLGMGDDGHTASLVPGDRVLEMADRCVAMSAPYKGRRRMTLTFPVLDRAWTVLWLVCGAAKHDVLQRVWAGDRTLPAGRVSNPRAVWHVDLAAAGENTPVDRFRL